MLDSWVWLGATEGLGAASQIATRTGTLAVADVCRFEPALNRDQPRPLWVSFPVTFQVR